MQKALYFEIYYLSDAELVVLKLIFDVDNDEDGRPFDFGQHSKGIIIFLIVGVNNEDAPRIFVSKSTFDPIDGPDDDNESEATGGHFGIQIHAIQVFI
ncbi:hypothetical protein D9757_011888 [Collybiopsis confluens]|uniref:Uncharacterized protein n=1 Tax=Collybiopsis confluens TaxID=2823264 RepID=A0A8H5LQV7_9AGAR|nr:hypothetical protein D9757_011888 [Collybiopsis confluens]